MNKTLTCSDETIRNIQPAEVWNIILEDKRDEYILLDVRTPDEYADEHLPGAMLIPLNDLDKRYLDIDARKKIIVYCRSGRRSMGGAIILCQAGFSELYNMEGGILNWTFEKLKGPLSEAEDIFKDVSEIKKLIMFAIKMEKASQTFYMNVYRKLKDRETETTELFQKLSGLESDHAKRLYARLKEIQQDVQPFQDIHETEFMEGGISLPQILLLIESESISDKMDALEIALEKECRAFDLYKRMGANVEQPLRELFLELASEERGHIDYISRFL